MLWDLIQQTQIGRAQIDAQDAKFAASDAQAENRLLKSRIQTLEESVDRLSMVSMAIAEMLRDRFNVTENELETKIQEIDLRDGKLDGRFHKPAHECLRCHHKNSARRYKCLYCGELLPASSVFVTKPSADSHPAE